MPLENVFKPQTRIDGPIMPVYPQPQANLYTPYNTVPVLYTPPQTPRYSIACAQIRNSLPPPYDALQQQNPYYNSHYF